MSLSCNMLSRDKCSSRTSRDLQLAATRSPPLTSNARVPHPSQSHRDGWDAQTFPTWICFCSCFCNCNCSCNCFCRCFCFCPSPHPLPTQQKEHPQSHLLHVSKYIGTVAASHGAPGATDEQKRTGQPETPEPMHTSSLSLRREAKPRSNRPKTSIDKHSATASPSLRRAGSSANHGSPAHQHPAPGPV